MQMQTTTLEAGEFSLLQHHLQAVLDLLDKVPPGAVEAEQDRRWLGQMREDGARANRVMEAGAATRTFPESFVVELESWLEHADRVVDFLDKKFAAARSKTERG